jgi:hypothetical protein
MFWDRKRRTPEQLYMIIKEQHGTFQVALGAQARTYRHAQPAMTEAARLASKLNDGKYYVFQAISVSEVVSPRAVTRPLTESTEESLKLNADSAD